MKRIVPALLALVLALISASAAVAQEPAKYNFASAQGEKEIRVVPDGQSQGVIYFYNIDGNRITHVTLEVSQAPTGWQVDIQPPLGETLVEINGETVTVSENLYVEPSSVLSEAVDDTPEGIVCITVPERGYALAKEARIIIHVPAIEEIGATGEITIAATAQWLGQSGAAAIKQSRDFNFTVEVISEATEIHETVLDNNEPGIGLGKWLPAIVGAAGVVLGVMLTLLYIRRRRG